jgi:hypothetical protein
MVQPVKAYLVHTQSDLMPNTLAWYAEQAQARGLTRYEIGAGIHEYYLPDTWNDVLTRFSLVVAEPVELRSYPHPGVGGDSDIETWYRFRVVETLSTKTTPFPLGPGPSDMLPAHSDELFVFKWGGSLTQSGVQLDAIESDYPAYMIGQKYLVILDQDLSQRVGSVQMGSAGVFLVSSTGNLSSISPGESIFQEDLANRYSNSLDQLRASLKGSRHQP